MNNILSAIKQSAYGGLNYSFRPYLYPSPQQLDVFIWATMINRPKSLNYQSMKSEKRDWSFAHCWPVDTGTTKTASIPRQSTWQSEDNKNQEEKLDQDKTDNEKVHAAVVPEKVSIGAV